MKAKVSDINVAEAVKAEILTITNEENGIRALQEIGTLLISKQERSSRPAPPTSLM